VPAPCFAPSPLELLLPTPSPPSSSHSTAPRPPPRSRSLRAAPPPGRILGRPRPEQPEGQGCAARLMEERSGRQDPCCSPAAQSELGKGRDSESMGKEVGEGLRLVGAMAGGRGRAVVVRSSRQRPGEFVRERASRERDSAVHGHCAHKRYRLVRSFCLIRRTMMMIELESQEAVE
jgi:hypothetical protein